MEQIIVGQLGISWGVFRRLPDGKTYLLTPTLYRTEQEALIAFEAMQEVRQ